MLEKREKYGLYGIGILLLVMFVCGFILLGIMNPSARAKFDEIRLKHDAIKSKRKGDSTIIVLQKKLDSVVRENQQDSIEYHLEKKNLQIKLFTKKKEYEAIRARIDTLSDSAFNSSFSIHDMLSDSGTALYR